MSVALGRRSADGVSGRGGGAVAFPGRRPEASPCVPSHGTVPHRLLNNNHIRSLPAGAFEDLENLKYL